MPLEGHKMRTKTRHRICRLGATGFSTRYLCATEAGLAWNGRWARGGVEERIQVDILKGSPGARREKTGGSIKEGIVLLVY